MSRKRNLLIKHVMQKTQSRQSAGRHQRVEIVQKAPTLESLPLHEISRNMHAKPRKK